MKTLLGFGFVVGLIALSMQPSVLNAIIIFFCTGAIAGTSIVLPFWAMILLAVALAMISLVSLFRQSLFIGDIPRQHQVAQSAESTQAAPRTRRRFGLKRKTRKQYQPAHSPSA